MQRHVSLVSPPSSATDPLNFIDKLRVAYRDVSVVSDLLSPNINCSQMETLLRI
jgi:hypothetical protein